jgi:hypothetical protein
MFLSKIFASAFASLAGLGNQEKICSYQFKNPTNTSEKELDIITCTINT